MNHWTDEQNAVFDAVSNTNDNLIVQALAGTGKCLGAGTSVLMFDGSIRPVEQIQTGDVLMGPDSMPRRVLSTNSGYGKLFLITPIKGDPWVCNDVHVMTLVGTNNHMGKVRDIQLDALLAESAASGRRPDRNWKLFRVPVRFESSPVPVDPYLVGLWMGDGTRGEAQITNTEPEIRSFCKDVASKYGLELVERRDDRNNTWNLRFRIPGGKGGRNTPHVLRRFFKSCAEIGEKGYKAIPREYMINDSHVRRELLAGIIDTDGYVNTKSCQIAFSHPQLCNDTAFVARSLGLAAYTSIKTVRINNRSITYYTLSISGDLASIPCRVPRRQCGPRLQVKDVRRTGFSVDPIGDGDYFGFTLDGDGRFLLGDFTVTHNTTTIIEAAARIPKSTRVLLCAFSTDITKELESRAPKHVTVSSLHSLGFRALRNEWGSLPSPTSRDKHMLKRFLGKWPKKDLAESLSKVRNLLLTDADQVEAYVRRKVTSIDAGKAVEVIVQSILELNKYDGSLCFDDMLYVPVVMGMSIDQYDIVIVDETQDMNPVQLALAQKAVAPGGRLIVVGDPHQAIYGWRGADSGFMSRMETELSAPVMPMSTTFRCPQRVVDVARVIVPEFNARPNAPDGIVEVTSFESAQWRDGDVVISRTNAPLIKMAINAITRGQRARIAGKKDFVYEIKDQIKSMWANSARDLIVKTDRWSEAERKAALNLIEDEQERARRIEDISDTAEMVKAFAGGCDTIAQVEARVDDMVRESGPGIVFSTAHRAKGKEWDNVFLLAWTFKPSKSDEEANIWYVAVTRAKKALMLVIGGGTVGDPIVLDEIEAAR